MLEFWMILKFLSRWTQLRPFFLEGLLFSWEWCLVVQKGPDQHDTRFPSTMSGHCLRLMAAPKIDRSHFGGCKFFSPLQVERQILGDIQRSGFNVRKPRKG